MTSTSGNSRWSEHKVSALWTMIGGVVFASSAPFWWTPVREYVLPTWLGGTADVASIDSGCPDGWQVFAENQWKPVGTAVRKKPDIDAAKIDGIDPNIPFTVDGWVHASVAYEHNQPPFNSDVWLHRKSGGWVSFAGVRAAPTEFENPSVDGIFPAPLPADCEGDVG